MGSEYEKGKIEKSIFVRFAAAAGLNFQSVEKQSPEEGKPDLKCMTDGKVIYFELTEACSEDVAKAISHPKSINCNDLSAEKSTDKSTATSSSTTNYPSDTDIKDYTSETYKKKINKRYSVSEPIDLLIYNVGRTLLTDDVLVNNVKALAKDNKGPFRKVWYFGEHVTEL
ncbi:hypothetical protein ACFL6Z_05365 [Pseudomonadota bacterium]|uniref:hypothetical protein n=1 Tax=unclassified Shewanella TaxID=196818 RepID=UPI000C844C2F|nr:MULTISPECIES: hypothetical protein [unclassified Shewanella]MDO6620661.1 hypothetical protein [Shewanella sp. 6_MG-2023]MDO6641693.1 hypothetical protein [Shewanella sp. 5_MG-2023]MDO6677939.1 hypothetical protein [Shewanella sp. 4_MG-2023]MDO6777044.1 hypothetical protein [Shewanella sp. 3_MG-2023]PMG27122.1 hypothetical protein BCU94_19175 [Shewanella sp. 10N.286.52.C2]